MTKTLVNLMKAETKRLMEICEKELTNTLLFVSEDKRTIGTATITVGRYEIKDIIEATLKDDNTYTIMQGREINPYFTVELLTRKEYNEALRKQEELNKQALREKACEKYFG